MTLLRKKKPKRIVSIINYCITICICHLHGDNFVRWDILWSGHEFKWTRLYIETCRSDHLISECMYRIHHSKLSLICVRQLMSIIKLEPAALAYISFQLTSVTDIDQTLHCYSQWHVMLSPTFVITFTLLCTPVFKLSSAY